MKWLRNKKAKLGVMLMTALCAVMTALPVFAEDGTTGTANAAVKTAMTNVANDMVATGTEIIPIALTVVGISLVVIYGIKMFKRIANK